MCNRNGCHVVGQEITTLRWGSIRTFGQFARLISVPSRVCIVVSLLYYTMSAACVAAAAAQSNSSAWRNQTGEQNYLSDTSQQLVDGSLPVLRSASPPEGLEYTDVSVRDVEDRDRLLECTREGQDEQDYSSNSPTTTESSISQSYGETGSMSISISVNTSLNETRLPPGHRRLLRELKLECARAMHASDSTAAIRSALNSFSTYTLPFCDRYVLAHVVMGSSVRDSCHISALSALESDAKAAKDYANFTRVSHNFDGALWQSASTRSATEPQLVLGEECLRLYKEWLCANTFPLYFEYQTSLTSGVSENDSDTGSLGSLRVLPCVEVCRQVEEKCPFFVPDPDDGSGDAAFVCPLIESSRFNEYALDACYSPSCHLETLRNYYDTQKRTASPSRCNVPNADANQGETLRRTNISSRPTARCAPLTRDVGNDSRAVLDLNELLPHIDVDASLNASESLVQMRFELVRARLEPLPSSAPAVPRHAGHALSSLIAAIVSSLATKLLAVRWLAAT